MGGLVGSVQRGWVPDGVVLFGAVAPWLGFGVEMDPGGALQGRLASPLCHSTPRCAVSPVASRTSSVERRAMAFLDAQVEVVFRFSVSTPVLSF